MSDTQGNELLDKDATIQRSGVKKKKKPPFLGRDFVLRRHIICLLQNNIIKVKIQKNPFFYLLKSKQ